MTETGLVTPGARKDPARFAEIYARVRELCRESGELRRTDPRRSLRVAEDALAQLGDAREDADARAYRLTHFDCLYQVGIAHERLSDYPEAIRYGKEAMRIAEALAADPTTDPEEREQPLRALSNACNLLGNTYDRVGDFMMSLHYRRHNMEIATRQGTRDSRAHALLQLASGYYRLADYPTTLNCYQEALQIFEDLGDRNGAGSAWNGIGNVQYSEGDFEEAAASYGKGLALFEELNEPYWQAGLLGNIAGAYLEVGRTDDAREAALRSLVLRARIGDRHGQGYSHDSLARIYLKMGRAAKAREAALRSLSLFEEVNDRTGLVYAARTLGRACLELGEYALALRHFKGALATAEKAGLRELVYQLYEHLSETHEKTGDAATALDYHKKFHAAREALFNEESDRRLRNLQALYEVERARREADLYRQHNRDLESANAVQSALLVQLRDKSAELERQARTDGLTGLYNRRHFSAAFGEAFAHARETGEPLSVALMDVDHFKEVNDRHSHAAGDAVLVELARLLLDHARPGEILARYGGEEFVLAFPGLPFADAAARCEALRAAVESAAWPGLPEDRRVTLSVGLATADPDTAHPDHLLSSADARLYAAKAAGRNRVVGPPGEQATGSGE